jgi:hypothetical protein
LKEFLPLHTGQVRWGGFLKRRGGAPKRREKSGEKMKRRAAATRGAESIKRAVESVPSVKRMKKNELLIEPKVI